MNRSRRHLLPALAAVLVLPGCGFALRGAPTLAFESLRVRVFTSAVPASPEGETGQVVLTVLTDQRERAVVGQTAAGQVRELQLRTRFRFRLTTAQGVVLLDTTELLLERDISYSETAALSKEAEEALQYRDMQRDIVQQAMRRLTAVKLP